MAIYLTTTILAVVVIVTIVWDENLTIYSAAYAYGSAVATTAILVIVFFTKVQCINTRAYTSHFGYKHWK